VQTLKGNLLDIHKSLKETQEDFRELQVKLSMLGSTLNLPPFDCLNCKVDLVSHNPTLLQKSTSMDNLQELEQDYKIQEFVVKRELKMVELGRESLPLPLKH
jgi:hypothetical protein